MNEQQIASIEIETVEETEELTVETVVAELVEAAFADGVEETTAYKIATIINGAFKVLEVEKTIPTQMMYNYDRNGLIVKGKKAVKRYSKAEVQAFVTKYVGKYAK